MPNGKPGDHPYTDIVIHNATIFGDGVDDLVRELDVMSGFAAFRHEVSELLASNEPVWSKDPDIPGLERRLLEIKAILESAA